MKILIIGSGGREHTLAWKIAQSKKVKKIYCAPGNAGIAEIAECVPIDANDIEALAEFAEKESIDLTIVGPEDPLAKGIVDLFEKKGLKIFGPSQKAAEIEASKSFAKKLMLKYGIPTARGKSFTDIEEASIYIDDMGAPIVVKADGLAAGKGVLVCQTREEAKDALNLIMVKKAFGDAGKKVLIEDFLSGEEASFIAFTDGKNVLPLPTSQDHKPIFDGDKGPNTGGMGAYSPAPVAEPLTERIMNEIMIPTVKAMIAEGRPYKGVLYAGLMIDGDKINVVEFNCRFGDPEAQPLLMRLKSDIVPIMEAVVDERLDEVSMDIDSRPALCVVLANKGYPGDYSKGNKITGLSSVAMLNDVMVFHAGTGKKGDDFRANGGRVLGVTALGSDILEAFHAAYAACDLIQWLGKYNRKDIGAKAKQRLKKKKKE